MRNITAVFAVCLLSMAACLTANALGKGAYYGTNYTVPFAHAYRALDTLGIDHRQAIDRDVHHMSALGLDAFRIHIWDVEITDSVGNLIDNEHLELLDYLIARLEENGFSIILTAQTNFGNGYPERNTDPNGAFSYRYPKCRIHDTDRAVDAQERYIKALVNHTNTANGKSYAADPAIIALEINNEPCHSGDHTHITAYVNRMVSALREAGWKKDILYNVSHNLWRTSAFYNADIDGTTFQWYPSGLVHGSRRKGNFLPVLDSYDIPFDTVPGYERPSKVIYEYDPADVLDTYLFPAAARTFRKAGFEWVTQFAYDPVDMARFNTEYQTHYLNLAYTPGKAIGMAIAAEAMRRIPCGTDYGTYPADTIFGPGREFSVSARRDLAMLNDGTHYYHTNNTGETPRNHSSLKVIKGVGSSPAVTTDGTGAYFLDRLDNGTWRLELMPDVVVTSDPFGRPSLSHSVASIFDNPVTMTLDLPGLPDDFHYTGRSTGRADGHRVVLLPGTYLLGAASRSFNDYPAGTDAYAMPPVDSTTIEVVHTPAPRLTGDKAHIEVTVASATTPDSVVLYPADADFWRDDNKLYRMVRQNKYKYSATVDPEGKKEGLYGYYIVVYHGSSARTFPGNLPGTPLSWDFGAGASPTPYVSTLAQPSSPVVLLNPANGSDGAEMAMAPETWQGLAMTVLRRSPMATDAIVLSRQADAPATDAVVVTKYVGDITATLDPAIGYEVRLRLGECTGCDSVTIGLVNADGFTYSATVPAESGKTVELPASGFTISPTMLNPAPYPAFMSRFFHPDPATATPLEMHELEKITVGPADSNVPFSMEIEGLWLEPAI